jgi:hypothetical protein
MLTLMGWWLVLMVSVALPMVLGHADYSHPSPFFGGLLVLTLYLVVVAAIVILLLRSGRRLRGK